MNWGIPITELGYFVGGVIGSFFLRYICPYEYSNLRDKREKRYNWYSEVSSLALKASRPWQQEGDSVVVQYIERQGLNDTKSGINSQLNPPFQVDRDIHNKARKLANRIDEFNSSVLIRNLEEGDSGIPLDVDNPGNGELGNSIELGNEISRISSELEEECQNKVESRCRIPILNIRV